jgi:formamidopyrimidine-DNA glycosylase
MPELPEVETVRRILHPEIVGRRITGVSLRDFPAVLESSLPGIDPASSLVGHAIMDTARRGKYLFLELDGGLVVIIHLRMTGRLLLVPSSSPPVRFEHLAIHLDDGLDIRFGDQRKFGRVVLAEATALDTLDRKLGPEPFSARLTPDSLAQSLSRRPGKVKNALLDQSVIAGLGNIYVDEALYRARIHPAHPSNTLDIEALRKLLRAIRVILNQAISRQGTTFSSFENPYGEPGENVNFLRAYGRARDGGRCPRCGTPFMRTVVGGRGTTFCPHCQVIPAPTHPGVG